jgi:hypothetical protein
VICGDLLHKKTVVSRCVELPCKEAGKRDTTQALPQSIGADVCHIEKAEARRKPNSRPRIDERRFGEKVNLMPTPQQFAYQQSIS